MWMAWPERLRTTAGSGGAGMVDVLSLVLLSESSSSSDSKAGTKTPPWTLPRALPRPVPLLPLDFVTAAFSLLSPLLLPPPPFFLLLLSFHPSSQQPLVNATGFQTRTGQDDG